MNYQLEMAKVKCHQVKENYGNLATAEKTLADAILLVIEGIEKIMGAQIVAVNPHETLSAKIATDIDKQRERTASIYGHGGPGEPYGT